MQASRRSKRTTRGGTILPLVLASLLVAAMMGLALVKTVLVNYRQMHVAGQQQQCSWLAEAGLQRAVQRLANAPEYQGEQWTVPAEVLGAARPGVVRIEVTEAPGSPQARHIQAEARFPDDPVHRTTCRRELVVTVGPDNHQQP